MRFAEEGRAGRIIPPDTDTDTDARTESCGNTTTHQNKNNIMERPVNAEQRRPLRSVLPTRRPIPNFGETSLEGGSGSVEAEGDTGVEPSAARLPPQLPPAPSASIQSSEDPVLTRQKYGKQSHIHMAQVRVYFCIGRTDCVLKKRVRVSTYAR